MPESDYMNTAQLQFFREQLLTQRVEVLEREREIRVRLSNTTILADPADRALAEESRWLDLRLRYREASCAPRSMPRCAIFETATTAGARSRARRSASRVCWRAQPPPPVSMSRPTPRPASASFAARA